LCVRWYLRYPLSYEHVSELMTERGVDVDASCIWRLGRGLRPELNKRCRPYLKPTDSNREKTGLVSNGLWIISDRVADTAGNPSGKYDQEGKSEICVMKT